MFLETLAMLIFWTFIGTRTALICRNTAGKSEAKKNPLLHAAAAVASVIIGVALMLIFPSGVLRH